MALVALSALVPAATASAHAQLESTQPSPSEVLVTPPRQVVLHFGEPVEIDFGSIRVIGPNGQRIDDGGTHHPPSDTHSVEISLPGHLGRGTYVVAWRVISADSHPVHGAFVFSIGTAQGSGKANVLARDLTNASGGALVGVVFWVVRTATFTGLFLLVGAAAMLTLLWPAAWGRRRPRRVLWVSWAVVLFGSVAGIAVQGVYAGTLPLFDLFRPSLFDEVLQTRFGEIEVLRIALLAAFAVLLVVLSKRHGTSTRPAPAVAVGLLGLALLATPGLSGHAGTTGNVWVGEGLDLAHLGAVSVWLGGLTMLAILLFPARRDAAGGEAGDAASDPEDDALWPLAKRFLTFAFGAVVVVVASGVIQSIRQVGSFYALFHTSYGRTLIVKVALVTVLIGVGGLSRRAVHRATGHSRGRLSFWPRRLGPASADVPVSGDAGVDEDADADEGAGAVPVLAAGTARATTLAPARVRTVATPNRRVEQRRALRRTVAAEMVIAFAVLAVTGLLVNAVPAKQAAALPFSQSFTVLGVQVNTIVDPARAGPGNQFHFYVLGKEGQPVAIPELDASIDLAAQGVGPIALPLVVTSPGHYQADGVDIPLAGNWTLTLTVRTSAIDEQPVSATVPIR